MLFFRKSRDILRRIKPQETEMVDILLLKFLKHLIKDHMLQIKNAIDFYSKSYENIILTGDFNVEISDSHMGSFCAIYHFKSLIKEPTCYKNPEKPTCIDLILTNSPRQFQATLTLETGLSDFHKMTVATFKSEFPHQKSKIISY